MNFHFHNKCRPTTCFKHYNAHKFIFYSILSIHFLSSHCFHLPFCYLMPFLLDLRNSGNKSHCFAPTMNCWGLYMGLGYCMEAETSQHVLALSLPYYYRLKTSPGQGHYSVCPSRVGISGSESQYSS